MSPIDGPDRFKGLIATKERELREINELRLSSLQQAVDERDAALQDAREKFLQLREDFEFNLKLLEERDSSFRIVACLPLRRVQVALRLAVATFYRSRARCKHPYIIYIGFWHSTITVSAKAASRTHWGTRNVLKTPQL